MKKQVGLWIDQYRTVIVTLEDEVDVTREIRSNLEKHLRASHGTRAKISSKLQALTVETDLSQNYTDHLKQYYDGVVSFIRSADSILIFGPGEAKTELEKRLQLNALDERIVAIESTDRMTDRQIAAKVRDHFLR